MEKEKTKSKKKLWITLGSLAIVLIVGLGITVGVLAAASLNVSNSVNVSYTSVQVAARVSATYQVHGSDPVAFETESGATTITFNGSETGAGATGSFEEVDDITLSFEHQYVVFSYTFINDTSASITATCTLPTTQTNVTITEKNGSDVAIVNHQLTIAAGQTGVYKITVAIDNLALNSTFAGSFGWVLARAS